MRSGPGEARTILLLHIISVRPSKQTLMVRTFLKVYMELGSSLLFLQEQIKDIIIIITACTAEGTHTRWFVAWMSQSEDRTLLIDPVHMRNESQASR